MRTDRSPESPDEPQTEAQAVAERYARRQVSQINNRYSFLQPDVWQAVQERQRALLQLLRAAGIQDLNSLQLLEVGCGTGGNLLELLRMGFAAENLQGLELLPERFAAARQMLPVATRLRLGDAAQAEVASGSLDLVLVSTLFSSLLDEAFQDQLARRMWDWLKPGGAVIWYDFTVNNPRNPDVRGVPLPRVQQLFAQGQMRWRRVTLAPPLSRAVCLWHPALYRWLNALPFLRTHVLVWIAKPR